MLKKLKMFNRQLGNGGMEMIQVAILIALAIIVGLIFKDQISSFVQSVFRDLNKSF